MRLINRLQVFAIKSLLICFMIIVAVPATGVNYLSNSIKKSGKGVKVFLVISLILTGELPDMTHPDESTRDRPTTCA